MRRAALPVTAINQDGSAAGLRPGVNIPPAVANQVAAGEIDCVTAGGFDQHAGQGLPAGAVAGVVVIADKDVVEWQGFAQTVMDGFHGGPGLPPTRHIRLIGNDDQQKPRGLEIGQRSVMVALQSIWIGIILSIGLMVAAAFGHIPAVAGALAQELVDLATILNALRALEPARAARGSRPQPSRTRDYARAGE